MIQRGLPVVALSLLLTIAAAVGQEPASEPQEDDELVVLGTRSALGGAETDEDHILVEAGTALLQYPSSQAPQVDVVPTSTELVVLDRRGDWTAVRYRSMKVWFARGARPAAATVELPPLVDPDQRLHEARSSLGGEERILALGPFTLYTDVESESLLDRLAVAAADLTRAYGDRYGVEPRLDGNEAVVLFLEEGDYRRHEGSTPETAGLDPHGHADATLALLSVGDRRPDAVRQLLIHELTHLLNRRALARELPPWLEEGLAEDLSYLEVDRDGRLDPRTLSGRGTFMTGTRSRDIASIRLREAAGTNAWGSSPRASLAWILHSWKSDDRPAVETLVDLPWVPFVDPGYREFHYAESGFLVRYLLDERSGHAPQLKALLGRIAAGGEATGGLFWSSLDMSPRQFEERFYTWLLGEALAFGVPRPIG